jgi:hypothetical protein
MTFNEYKNQENPRWLPKGSVKVRLSETHSVFKVLKSRTLNSYGHLVTLEVGGKLYQYYVDPGDTLLWVFDDYGYKQSSSVFSLTEPL